MLTWLRSQTPRCPWDDWTATVAYEHGHMSVGAWFGELWQSSKKKLRPPAPSLGATTLQGFRGRSSLDFVRRSFARTSKTTSVDLGCLQAAQLQQTSLPAAACGPDQRPGNLSPSNAKARTTMFRFGRRAASLPEGVSRDELLQDMHSAR